jgi:hypothetical protein
MPLSSSYWMSFDVSKLYTLKLASVPEAHKINRRKVVARALKAVAEAISRERRAIRATTIFFLFFSY